jgi:hypothetical protein
LAILLISPAIVHAEPADSEPADSETQIESRGSRTIEELHEHAETIAVILETASERVEELSASNAETPMLLEAIRQEISLSRRWNRHLGTILREVTEARRALGEREREAAKEIARMTAAAEEARLELIALRSVLEGAETTSGETKSGETWSDSALELDPQAADRRRASTLPETLPTSRQVDDGLLVSSLRDTRLELAFMHEAQSSALRDVESVRAKIFEALQTLAVARSDMQFKRRHDGGLTDEDITSWAASIAARANIGKDEKAD